MYKLGHVYLSRYVDNHWTVVATPPKRIPPISYAPQRMDAKILQQQQPIRVEIYDLIHFSYEAATQLSWSNDLNLNGTQIAYIAYALW